MTQTHNKIKEEMQQLIDLEGEELFVAGTVLDRHGLLAEFNRELEHFRRRESHHEPKPHVTDEAVIERAGQVLNNGDTPDAQAKVIEGALIRHLGAEK